MPRKYQTAGLTFSVAPPPVIPPPTDWWLAGSAVDMKFTTSQYRDSSNLATDPLLANTVLMLHGDGADASTNISDSTGRNFMVPINSMQIDTAQSKFGGSSILCGTTNTLHITDTTDVTFGTGSFTVDLWFRLNSSFTGNENTLVYFSASPDFRITTRFDNDKLQFACGAAVQVSNSALSADTWYHCAAVRNGTDVKLFLDGVEQTGNGIPQTSSDNLVANAFNIGNDPGGNRLFGWIDEFRVVKGVAAWTANFTPPTAAYNVGIGPYDELSCSRASIGYATTSTGTLTQFAANQLRITTNGLLVEDSRTNLIALSVPDDSTWQATSNNTSVTLNNAVTPDGTTTATLIQDTASNTYHSDKVVCGTLTNAVTYAASVYVKAGTLNFAQIGLQVNAGSFHAAYATINLTTGAITQSGSTGVDITFVSANSEALANGWFRVWVTATPNTTDVHNLHILLTNTGTGGWAFAYVGGTGTIYAWGAQVEAGTFASSYIPTTTAAATRAADAVACIGALEVVAEGNDFSIVMNIKETSHLATDPTFFSNSTVEPLTGFSAATTVRGYIFGEAITSTIGNSLQTTDGVKIGTCWTIGVGRSLVGGGGTVVAGSNTPSGQVGYHLGGASNPSFTYYRRLTVWTSRLADATLQGFTAP